MKTSGKYMVEKMGLFGVEREFGDSFKLVMKKARITRCEENEFRMYSCRNGEIVRINKSGRAVAYK